MIANRYRKLVGKRNSNMTLGLPLGSWLVVDHKSGGGFAGAPQELWLRQLDPVGKEASLYLDFDEFPPLCSSVVYHIGGRIQELSDQAINGMVKEFMERRKILK